MVKRPIGQKIAAGVLVAFAVAFLGIDTPRTAFLVQVRAFLVRSLELLERIAAYALHAGVVYILRITDAGSPQSISGDAQG